MAHITADRVRDTSQTTGTGAVTLTATALGGYRLFSAVCSVGDTLYYCIQHQTQNEWEVGLGTYSAANTLTRTTIYSSSNAGSAVNFSSGYKDVFLTLAASRTLQMDNDGDVVISANSTSDALRITQAGAGNALLVEDSTNPDASPFAVNTNGQVLVGAQTAPFGSTNIGIFNNTADTAPAYQDYFKNRAGLTTGNNDGTGQSRFWAYDGTTYLNTAAISSSVDGTVSTGDAPGRLSFFTRAVGGSGVTERMRIDNTGAVGISSSTLTGYRLRVAGSATGSTTMRGISSGLSVQSDVTAEYRSIESVPNLTATVALTNLSHFYANEGSYIAGYTLTNSYGFHATNGLIGATNSYGFYGNIASGTGRWNFYANGTAPNYFAGNVGVGTTSPGAKLDVVGPTASSGSGSLVARMQSSAADTGTYYNSTKFAIQNTNSTSGTMSYLGFVAAGGNDYASVVGTCTTHTNGATVGYLAFGTNNGSGATTERMRITSTGDVGIGTSSPQSKLSIVPSQSGAYVAAGNSIEALAPGISNGGAIYFGLGTSSATTPTGAIEASWGSGGGTPQIHFGLTRDGGKHRYSAFYDGTLRMYTSDVERMRVDNSGNVGIGTSSPGFKLEVVGGTNNGIHIKDAASATVYGGLFTQASNMALVTRSNHALTFGTNDTERMRIDASGNVGVGTSSPSVKLDVVGTSGPTIRVLGTSGIPTFLGTSQQAAGYAPSFLALNRIGASGASTPSNETIGEIRFTGLDAASGYDNFAYISSTIGTNASGGAPSILVFATASSGANATERMRIDSSGNVGIGSASTGYKLEVFGTLGSQQIVAKPNGAEGGEIALLNPDGSTGGVLDISGANNIRLFSTTNNSVHEIGQLAGTGGTIKFYTAGSERMRITAEGNVGVGTTTPQNFGSTFKNLQVTGTDYGVVQATGGAVTAELMGSGAASVGFVGTRTNHPFILRTFDTERVRITTDGKLGVGTTNPTATVTAYSGGTNATTYNTMIAAGGGSTCTVQNQGTTSVSTTATTILTSGQYGSFCLVFGSDGTNRFMDVVLFGLGTGNVNVISSLNVAGTPSARTYSQSSSTYKLAMASGTYTVQVSAFTMSG